MSTAPVAYMDETRAALAEKLREIGWRSVGRTLWETPGGKLYRCVNAAWQAARSGGYFDKDRMMASFGRCSRCGKDACNCSNCVREKGAADICFHCAGFDGRFGTVGKGIAALMAAVDRCA